MDDPNQDIEHARWEKEMIMLVRHDHDGNVYLIEFPPGSRVSRSVDEGKIAICVPGEAGEIPIFEERGELIVKLAKKVWAAARQVREGARVVTSTRQEAQRPGRRGDRRHRRLRGEIEVIDAGQDCDVDLGFYLSTLDDEPCRSIYAAGPGFES